MKSRGTATRQLEVGQSWFAMAVHILALLARSPEGYPSGYLAGSVNTHAAFLRKVMAHLVRAGLVVAQEGREGGYRLARPADRIGLGEVYRVMYAGGPVTPSPAEPNPLCEVGSGMRAALGEVSTELERQMVLNLDEHTIAEVSDRAVALGHHPEAARAREEVPTPES